MERRDELLGRDLFVRLRLREFLLERQEMTFGPIVFDLADRRLR